MAQPPIHRRAPDEPKASVVIVHGIAEWSRRYEHVVDRLVAAGYETYTFDLRGHGEADGWPGKVSGAADWIDDVGAVLAVARDAGERPLFLLAHSMGTLVTLAYLADRGAGGLAGIVLSGLGISPTEEYLEIMADPDAPGIPPEWLSHDEAMNRDYAEDPKIFYADVPAECMAAAMESAALGFPAIGKLTLPVLFVHGGADRIVSASGSQEAYEAVGSHDKTIRIYDGLYHEIFNETSRDEVLAHVVAWLDAHV